MGALLDHVSRAVLVDLLRIRSHRVVLVVVVGGEQPPNSEELLLTGRVGLLVVL